MGTAGQLTAAETATTHQPHVRGLFEKLEAYPSVPNARGTGTSTVPLEPAVAAAADIATGLSPWLCKVRPAATVEMACLKISCSWLLVSSTTEYLSKERIRPVSFTPLKR